MTLYIFVKFGRLVKKVKVNEREFKIVGDKAGFEVKERKTFPVGRICSALMEGEEIFIPDINRQQANYFKHKIEEKFGGLPVDSRHGVYLPTSESGYKFKISWMGELKKELKEEILKSLKESK